MNDNQSLARVENAAIKLAGLIGFGFNSPTALIRSKETRMKTEFPTPSARSANSVPGSSVLSRVGSLFMNGIYEPAEIWKSVAGYEGLYEVSNYGAVRRLTVRVPHGSVGSIMRRGKVLTQKPNNKGYPTCGLCKDGKCKLFGIHRLVAIAFLPNPNDLPEVDHVKSNRADNRAWRLEWVTQTENIRRAFKLGRFPDRHGEGAGNAKLKEHQVLKIRTLYPIYSQGEIAAMFGVSKPAISGIITRRNWYHI